MNPIIQVTMFLVPCHPETQQPGDMGTESLPFRQDGEVLPDPPFAGAPEGVPHGALVGGLRRKGFSPEEFQRH